MNSTQNISDTIFSSKYRTDFEKIRDALWDNTASVFIGSGFSLNANPKMPSWGDWANKLKEKMMLSGDTKANIKAQDVPWLAGAYAQRHTDAELHELLLRPLQELKMQDSYLHEMLVSLPWVDIFTTNYDHFLEEASDLAKSKGTLRLPIRTVAHADDLRLSRRNQGARIIKMHGCLHNLGGCILTEEQYRKYRDTHAPFVNTIRQSLLENHLCLIGYSASDPDFLEWIGWVRDKFERSNLKIYWLTPADLSTDEISVYEQRGISCISINCFIQSSLKNDIALQSASEQQIKAVDSQLSTNKNSLHYESFNNFFQWLANKPRSAEVDNSGQLPVSETQLSWQCPNIESKWGFRGEEDYISTQVSKIQEAHRNYPNWIIPPEDIFNNLWNQSESALSIIDEIYKHCRNEDINKILSQLYEVSWLLNISGMPNVNDTFKPLCELLVDIIYPKIKEYLKGEESYKQYAQMWCQTSMLALRWAREDCYTIKFEKIYKITVKIASKTKDVDILSEALYCKTIFEIERLNVKNAQSEISKYKKLEGRKDLWDIRFARILCELGKTQEAYTVLTDIHQKINHEKIESLSIYQKSVIQFLEESLEQLHSYTHDKWSTTDNITKNFIPQKFTKKYTDNDLCLHNCFDYLHKLAENVASSSEQQYSHPSRIKFEIGKRNNSKMFYSGLFSSYKSVFKFFHASHQLSYGPYFCGFSMYSKTWLLAARTLIFLQKGVSSYALRILLRSTPSDTFKDGKDVFLQYYLTTITEETAHTIIKFIISRIKHVLKKKSPNRNENKVIIFSLEILGRLYLRITNNDEQRKIIDAILEWTENGEKWVTLSAFREFVTLLNRIIKYSPTHILQGKIFPILSSPVCFGFKNTIVAQNHIKYSFYNDVSNNLAEKNLEFNNIESYYALSEKIFAELQVHCNNISSQEKNNNLNSIADLISSYYIRLLFMYNNCLMNRYTHKSLAKLLWKNNKKDILPKTYNLYPFALLKFPVPHGIDVLEIYKTELLNKKFDLPYILNSDNKKSFSYYRCDFEDFMCIQDELFKKLNLNDDDFIHILDNCRESLIFDDDTRNFEEYYRVPVYSFMRIFMLRFGDKLESLLPKIPWLQDWINSLIKYAKQINARHLRLKVIYILFNKSDDYLKNLFVEIEEGLHSDDHNARLEAGFAILMWRSIIDTSNACKQYPNIKCPSQLCIAIVRGFWLLDDEKVVSLSTVIAEHINSYGHINFSDEEQFILLAALKKHRLKVNYESYANKYLKDEHGSFIYWAEHKEKFEFLPEYRLAIGKVVSAICKSKLRVRESVEVQNWIAEMKNDPLASMRNEAEIAENALKGT